MVDLSKFPDEKTLDEFAKFYNMPKRISLWPYFITMFFLPIVIGYILYKYKIHTYLIVSCVIIIILIEYFFLMNFLKKQIKKK